jgi:uncharacterized protein with HEPN domain
MRDENERLLDILDAIERIKKYSVRGRSAFEQDELVQNWVLHYIQVIGEAAARVGEEMREAHPEIPWTRIIGTRNILVHQYFDIDMDVVWSVVEKDLPMLERGIRAIVS